MVLKAFNSFFSQYFLQYRLSENYSVPVMQILKFIQQIYPLGNKPINDTVGQP